MVNDGPAVQSGGSRLRELSVSATTRRGLACILGLGLLGVSRLAPAAEAYIVRDGQPKAEIVIAERPARMTKVAAQELKTYVARISGAQLPVTTRPSRGVPVQIYVGKSIHTDRFGVTAEGLKHGAFRMVAGENRLILLGPDADHVPREPWAHSASDKDRVMRAWDALTGEKWGNPRLSVWRRYCPVLDIWDADDRGTLNAVYAFLKRLGMRWYFPGELGKIVPKMASIPLPQIDETVRPDFPVRHMFFYFNEFFQARKGLETKVEDVKWQLWLGTNPSQEVLGYSKGHGTIPVHSRDEVKKAHPEYYALWGGKRATEHLGNYGAGCLSSEGLFQQNVRYVRAVFDAYDEPMISVAPADGYTSLCQCDLCKGKGTPERGWYGQLSDYVWAYTDRVAREVLKTHPRKKITCIAYGAYQLPPQKIATLSPNIVVGLCRWRSLFHDRDLWQRDVKLRQDWLKKLPSGQLFIWDYYLHGRPGRAWEAVPVYFHHSIAKDLRSLKGISLGDYIETYRNHPSHGNTGHALAANHLNCYVTARLLWDADQDLEALLAEYCRKFYGPASRQMRDFIDYTEANWMKASKDAKVIDRLFELIGAARGAAGDTVYGQRVELLVRYMSRLKQLRERLAKGREANPQARALQRDRWDIPPIKVDGVLDDKLWERLPGYTLRDLQTGAPPHWGTSFRVAWSRNALCLGIHCKDRGANALNIAAKAADDTNIWKGDAVEILLETQTHTYYQIAISPAGAVVDLDRKQGFNTLWSSGAQVACRTDDDGWTVEVRLPVAGEGQAQVDPRNGVDGRRPTETYPWYFNVCRQRVRPRSKEHTAFSPTGQPNFHMPMKFAKLYVP